MTTSNKSNNDLLTIAQIEAFLRAHLRGDVYDLAPIGFGGWSQAFSFRHSTANSTVNLVARFGRHVEDYEKDQYAMRFSEARLPIPRVLEIGQGLDRYFCLSERAYGEILEGLETTPTASIFRMLDALREADISNSTGFGGWDKNGNAPYETWQAYLLSVDEESERVHGWHDNMAQSPISTGAYAEALAYLKSHIHYCPDARHLLHTDLLHFNVLAEENTINAVVDWGNARYGDFLYELAAFTFYAPWHPALSEIDWRKQAWEHYQEIGYTISNFDDFDKRLRCYEAHIGLDGMAYNAFTQRWDHFENTAQRTLALINH
jgi:hygromycin-B 4-O-kinase